MAAKKPEQPRSKEFARVARNIRRMADRRIKRLERIIATTGDDYVRKGAEKRINELRSAAERTYINDRSGKRIADRTDAQRRDALKELSQNLRETQYIASERQMRSNEVTISELNKALAGAPSVYTEAEAKIVLRATQRAWQREGVKLQRRFYEAMSYYGKDNMAAFVSEILTSNTEAIRRAAQTPDMEMTPEQREAAEGEADEKESQQSPDYLGYVIAAPEPSGLFEPTKA